MRRGLFVVIYGPAGVGKSKQLEILDDTMRRMGYSCRRVKYPVYEQEPSGPVLDKVLHRNGNALTEQKMQELFAANRREFEPTLKSWLDAGVSVLAEDYKGTGVAWGIVRGISLDRMEELNSDQIDPDLAVLMDGPKRMERLQAGHPYEDEDEWYRMRKMYLQLADRYGWIRVGADAPILTVAGRIFAVVKPVITLAR
ncbi:MAG: hypothetical protein UX91_C0003G0023 [Candidatus Amesbacteria bacterium GW2011_GWB1_47_19]|nr:MAG: hypothetical protein UW51_C0003G0029 [Candidatus Amesbacteria bacterium GW2011_GWA1_44_24]KKU31454.1 MAG: hypothetical protein UX46_C0005G0023 [Candidatus Amesbacteria bacterium GW2011_GWC1_46_24]KKU67462.1 MAG: hypothetical protein UX91_C0003G0023 [Candidatus Amesbacteria bacterium GW2011_GWB1_47_19]OGD05111.1 MAG: hypothetical protein A2379_05020 [Candidatus Amesbacteria bacterium RIFOXYB1_FULL_47_13]HBC72469.1 hypothetical protein [Candidatus Amesbacteria bacterium]